MNPARTPPGPAQGFDIGETEDTLPRMMELFHRFGDIYRVYSPSRGNYTCVIHDPEHIKHVLVTNQRNYSKGVGLDRVKILLGNGIMVSEGDFWRRQRRMIQPAFHPRVLQELFSVVRRCNLDLRSRWLESARAGRPVNLTQSLSEMTLQIVLEAIFGPDLEEIIQARGENPFALVAEESGRDLQFALRFRALRGLVAEIIRERRQKPRPRQDFLALMMEARDESGQGMGERELIDEVMTLIIAGHETTASALAWTWYLLAQHPEVSRALQEEVAGLDPDRLSSWPHLEKLEITTQVIRESLRLYPPGWLLTRRARQEDRLGEYSIPAGEDVFISPYVVHRHPRFWEEPERFIPQRFGEENSGERPRFCYIPFGAGPRQCVGESLALVEMQVHLALAAPQIRFHLAPGQRVEMLPLVNLRMREDLWMIPELVRPREGNP